MFFSEILNKCNDDTKIFLQFYIEFMYYSSNNDSSINSSYTPYLPSNAGSLDNIQTSLLYFFILLFSAYSEIKELFNKYNLDIFNKFYVREAAVNHLKQLYKKYYHDCTVPKKFYDELLFNRSNEYAASLIRANIPLDRKICVERITINIINSFKFIISENYYPLNNQELLNDLEKMAKAKESGQIFKSSFTNNINMGFGEVLTNKHYEYNPLIGREKDLRNMYALLMDKEKSLIIHGLPGVGKTALVNGLAYNINKNNVPERLTDKQVVEVQASELVRGCKYVGMVEDRLLEIIDKLLNAGNAILFIDEIHTLIGLGRGENSNIDVSNILKPYLGDGRIKIVGATTTKEYDIILEDGAFARRFNGLEIKVPTEKEVLNILNEVLKRYKETEDIDFFTDEDLKNKILRLIINFSNRKNPNAMLQKELYNPDLALTILRNTFDFAMVDDKNEVDVQSLIEGFDSMDYFRDSAKKEFKEKALALTRTKSGIYVIS